MAHQPSPDHRPDPNENMPALRARVPEHVARGEISTGVIVVTGGTEYVLDFVRNLPRPNCIVARVVLPHLVMPQFIEALATNIELYRQRYGELPGTPTPQGNAPGTLPPPLASAVESQIVSAGTPMPPAMPPSPAPQANGPSLDASGLPRPDASPAANAHDPAAHGPSDAANSGVHKRHNPQEIYDDLKLRDEILSGAYANAVMIGHGPHEFSFDFITNFYPQSAVSCRVYLAAGHIGRLLESLKQSWEQLRPRLGYPPHGPAGPGGPIG
ncbi:MAG: DUF3467 domain-containing protein [Pirellula sp.]